MMLKIKVVMLAAVLILSSGCSEKTQQQVQDTGQAVVAEVKENAQEVAEVTRDAAVDAQVTANVKSALLASEKMDTAALNVDTVGKNVFLRGYVPSLEQKTLAEDIARNTVAADFTVANELLVGTATGSPSPTASETPAGASTAGTIIDDATPASPYSGSPSPAASPLAN